VGKVIKLESWTKRERTIPPVKVGSPLESRSSKKRLPTACKDCVYRATLYNFVEQAVDNIERLYNFLDGKGGEIKK
jgi:hypothetical protein